MANFTTVGTVGPPPDRPSGLAVVAFWGLIAAGFMWLTMGLKTFPWETFWATVPWESIWTVVGAVVRAFLMLCGIVI